MAVRAQQPQIIKTMVRGIAVDMVHFQRTATRHRMLLVPATHLATFTARFYQVGAQGPGSDPPTATDAA